MVKNILIVYTNYGTGHYIAAKALEEYIVNNYPSYTVEIMDPLTYTRPIINTIFAKVGNIVATKFRKFRGKLYKRKMYKDYMKNSWFFMFCTKLFWSKKLERKLNKYKPDVIISTQVGPTGLFAAHKDFINCKLISVFTDYGLHRMYTLGHEFIDAYCVPTEEIKQEMIKLGIESSKINVTGIPVYNKFIKKIDLTSKDKIISKYNLEKNNPVFLFVCGGGLGYSNAFSYFKKLLESEYSFSYIFVSGKNEKLFNKANNLAKKYNKKGKVLGYVENMNELIISSDMIIGKPGGIITSESLNLGVPICAIEPIPGQEINNSLFISNNNFGFYVTNLEEFVSLLEKIDNKNVDLEEYKNNIKNNFSKFSFINIDEF